MDFNMDDIKSQKGKITVVTGANTGLGYETTIALARTGMKVIMACRSMDKAEKAKAAVSMKFPEADVEIMSLDLSSLSSVREFAKKYRKKYKHLDILINNAGIMMPPYNKTEDGFESQFGVNHLGHFLLVSLLLDLMPNSSDSRVVSLSSIAHKDAKINFDDLQFENKYSKFASYGQSKLACLVFAIELHRRLEKAGKNILSVSAHPGVSHTELSRNIPKVLYSIMKYTFMPFVTHSPKEAAKPILLSALSSDVKGGEYYGPQGFKDMSGKPGIASKSKSALDKGSAERLWAVSEKLTSCDFNV